jgi:hypothetical protein
MPMTLPLISTEILITLASSLVWELTFVPNSNKNTSKEFFI